MLYRAISSRPPFGAASKSQYNENLPIVKDMIDSFTVEETGQVIQDDVEEDSDDILSSSGSSL